MNKKQAYLSMPDEKRVLHLNKRDLFKLCFAHPVQDCHHIDNTRLG